MDMHVHTCLSPCAELDMHPSFLVRAALEVGIDGFVVCDHNSAENAGAVIRAGQRFGVGVLAGMEITTAEEVHVQAILPDVESALELQSRVYRALPGKNNPDVFGMQVVVNEEGEVLGFNEHLLAGSTTLSLERTVEEVHRVGGLAVAAHADREGFGIIGHLGMIPADLPLDGIEVSAHGDMASLRGLLSRSLPLLRGSDAHRPSEIGRAVTFLWMDSPRFEELKAAFMESDGRLVLGGGKPMEEISMHILDIAQNAVEAGAKRIEIEIVEDPLADELAVEVSDDGRGIDPEKLTKVTDPFFTTRTTRKVGLGLAMLKQAAEAAGGELKIFSEVGKGTRVRATFRLGHLDRAPLGDIESTLLVLVVGNPDVAVRFRHARGSVAWEMDTEALSKALNGFAVSSAEGISRLRALIRSGEEKLPNVGNRQK